MLVSRHKNAGQNHDIKTVHRLSENVAEFKYLGTVVKYQIFIQVERKKRLNSSNICHHSVQNFFFSSAV
jgi:hypothetical protein